MKNLKLHLSCLILFSFLTMPAFGVPVKPHIGKPPTVSGVYFLSADRGHARVLQINANKSQFSVMFDAAIDSQIKGAVYVDETGFLSLRYFNGKKITTVRTTFGIVKGNLWIGVFRRDRRQKHCLRMVAGQPDFYGPTITTSIPEGDIEWNLKDKTWRVIPLSGKYETIPNVRLIEDPARGKPHRFLAAFEEKRYASLVKMYRKRERGLGPEQAVRIAGLPLSKDWNLKDAAQAKKQTLEEHFNYLAKGHFTRTRAGERGYYEDHGDVVIAPWSINLGPVGLMPMKRPMKELLGRWYDPQRLKEVHQVVEPTEGDKLPLIGRMAFGRAKPGRYQRIFTKMVYLPNQDGICHQIIGEFCQMGHADWAGHVYWFATTDGRIARYIYPSNHTPPSKAAPLCQVQIFLRDAR